MKQVILSGRAGKAGELRRTQGGDPVLGFSIAVDDGYGENKSTMWFDCSVWGKRATALEPHIGKGTALTVIGDLGRREHEGKTYLTVNIRELTLQGGKQDGDRQSAPARQERQANYDRDDPRTGGSYARDLDDDLPFAPEWR